MTTTVSLRHALPALTLDVSFQAPAGLTVLFGRSGAGKTTVINTVAGLLRPDRARIAVDGTVLCDTAAGIWMPPHRRRIGYVFQDARLFPHLSVRHNLTYAQRFLPRTERPPDMRRIVEMLGLGQVLDRRPGSLSGGERQRVAIGRAILANPRLILADEPLASLDADRKEEILPYFERLRDDAGVPILYVSHSASEVARLATTVVVLDGGRVARAGPTADVLGDPEILPLGARAAGAMLEARVVRHHDDGLTELSAGGLTLILPRVAAPKGAQVRVRIEAHDVMLSLSRPTGISALNILPGTVTELRPGIGPGVMVQIDTAGGAVLARITRRSATAMKLAVGQPIFGIVKAVSVAKGAIAERRTPPRTS